MFFLSYKHVIRNYKYSSCSSLVMANLKDHPGRIIVKNYPPNTTSRDLQIMFEKYGRIDDCKV